MKKIMSTDRLKLSIVCMILTVLLAPAIADAQRRSRPGNFSHSDQELESFIKATPVKARYIKAGAVFQGDMFFTSNGKGIKIATSRITFKANTYVYQNLSSQYDTEKKTSYGLKYKDKESYFKNYSVTGKYEVVKEGSGCVYLILYAENSKDIFAKMQLSGIDATSFEYEQDQILCNYKLI